MEFVDYKCLESLLIEGEELIATEGFGDRLREIITNLLKKLNKFLISSLINFITLLNKLLVKFKNKKAGIKNTLLSKQNDWRAKKYYPFLKQALTNIPDHIIDLTEKTTMMSYFNKNLSLKIDSMIESNNDILYDYTSRFDVITSVVNGTYIHLNDEDYEELTKLIETQKPKLEKCIDELKRTLEKSIKYTESSKNNYDETIMSKTQKYYTETTKIMNQFNTLFNNIVNFTTKYVTNEPLYEDPRFTFDTK